MSTMDASQIQVTYCTDDYRGDHAADVRIAFEVMHGETVADLVDRIISPGAHKSWIELRVIDRAAPPADGGA